jgi:hypothetical protein
MVEPMVSATAFSKAAGVHLTAVTAAIKQGRLQAYGKSGRRVSASFRGPKFLKLDEARQSFDESRIRKARKAGLRGVICSPLELD